MAVNHYAHTSDTLRSNTCEHISYPPSKK